MALRSKAVAGLFRFLALSQRGREPEADELAIQPDDQGILADLLGPGSGKSLPVDRRIDVENDVESICALFD